MGWPIWGLPSPDPVERKHQTQTRKQQQKQLTLSMSAHMHQLPLLTLTPPNINIIWMILILIYDQYHINDIPPIATTPPNINIIWIFTPLVWSFVATTRRKSLRGDEPKLQTQNPMKIIYTVAFLFLEEVAMCNPAANQWQPQPFWGRGFFNDGKTNMFYTT